MLVLVASYGLIQSEPGGIKGEFVLMPRKEPVDGSGKFLKFVVFDKYVGINEGVPKGEFQWFRNGR